MSEKIVHTSAESLDWSSHDGRVDAINQERAALEAEHSRKGRIGQFMGKRALREQMSRLNVEESQAFIDTLTASDPRIAAQAEAMDALRSAYHPEE